MSIVLFMSLVCSVFASEWLPAAGIDKNGTSMEAKAIKGVEALVNKDKKEYLSLCDERANKVFAKFPKMLDQLITYATDYDLLAYFAVEKAKFDSKQEVYWVNVRVGKKGVDNTSDLSVKFKKYDDVYLITY